VDGWKQDELDLADLWIGCDNSFYSILLFSEPFLAAQVLFRTNSTVTRIGELHF
jgi:hypothetical protein